MRGVSTLCLIKATIHLRKCVYYGTNMALSPLSTSVICGRMEKPPSYSRAKTSIMSPMITRALYFAIALQLGKFGEWHTTVLRKKETASNIYALRVLMEFIAQELRNALCTTKAFASPYKKIVEFLLL